MGYARASSLWNRFQRWLTIPGEEITSKIVGVYLVGLVALATAFLGGWLTPVISGGGAVVFVMAAFVIVHIAYALRASSEFDRTRQASVGRFRVTWLSYMDKALPGLGLVGTVLGAIQAFSAIDATAGADGLASMVGAVLSGLSVALYTTLSGLVLMLWTSIVTQLLSNNIEKADTAQIIDEFGLWNPKK